MQKEFSSYTFGDSRNWSHGRWSRMSGVDRRRCALRDTSQNVLFHRCRRKFIFSFRFWREKFRCRWNFVGLFFTGLRRKSFRGKQVLLLHHPIILIKCIPFGCLRNLLRNTEDRRVRCWRCSSSWCWGCCWCFRYWKIASCVFTKTYEKRERRVKWLSMGLNLPIKIVCAFLCV